MEFDGGPCSAALPLHVYEDRARHQETNRSASPSNATEVSPERAEQRKEREGGAPGAAGNHLEAHENNAGPANANRGKKRLRRATHKVFKRARAVIHIENPPPEQPPVPAALLHQHNDVQARQAGPSYLDGKRSRRTAAQSQQDYPHPVGHQQERAIGRNWWEGRGQHHAAEAGALPMEGTAIMGTASGSSQHGGWHMTEVGLAAAAQFPEPVHHPDARNRRQPPPFDAGMHGQIVQPPLHADTGVAGYKQQHSTPGHQQPWFPPDPPAMMPGDAAPHHNADTLQWMDGPGTAMPHQHPGRALNPEQLDSRVIMQLHQEVEAFARRAAPTEVREDGLPAAGSCQCFASHGGAVKCAQGAVPVQVEAQAVEAAAQIVRDMALELWPECTVGLFGSQASSLALPGSDIDITVLGVHHLPVAEDATGLTK